MTHPDQALELILKHAAALPAVETPLGAADGLRLAADVFAAEDHPAFDNSAMDGYALRAADGVGAPKLIRVAQTIAAGERDVAPLAAGTAARIMTGAPLPAGADTVVMRERTREQTTEVELLEAPEPGQNIRRRGEDIRAGAPLLAAGRRLGPYEVALLAAQGQARVKVHARPRVAVLSTGDELVACAETPAWGQIRDANGPGLAALLRAWDCQPVASARLGDDREALRAGLAAACAAADALFVTGGVSVGDFDYTRAALDDLGFEEKLWRIEIKPGKPLLFGLLRGKPVFGLPGNPLSALVTARVFARPALELMAGAPEPAPAFPERGRLRAAFDKHEHLRHYLFCRAQRGRDGVELEVLRPQGSSLLAGAARADALAVGEIGAARLDAGTELAFAWL